MAHNRRVRAGAVGNALVALLEIIAVGEVDRIGVRVLFGVGGRSAQRQRGQKKTLYGQSP